MEPEPAERGAQPEAEAVSEPAVGATVEAAERGVQPEAEAVSEPAVGATVEAAERGVQPEAEAVSEPAVGATVEPTVELQPAVDAKEVEPEPEPELVPAEEGVPSEGAPSVPVRLRKLELAYRAGALSRAVYESLVTQAGGVPVAAAGEDGVEAAVREAILEAKLGSLDKALRAGDVSTDRYQAMRAGYGAAPGPLPTSSLSDEQLPGSVAGNREWNSILRLLLVATEDGEEPPNAKVMIGLEEGSKTASAETCKRAAQWLAERFDDVPGSADVTLKNLSVASTFLQYGSSTMCNELAQACITQVEAAVSFQCKPHAYHGKKPMDLVRSNAEECLQLLRRVQSQAARESTLAERQHALVMDGRASLYDLEQQNTRPDFVHSPKTRKEEKKHQKMFKGMEKQADKQRALEKRAAEARAASAVIWGTEILKDFNGFRESKRGAAMIQDMMWGSGGFQGIPFEVRGQAWAAAIGNASGKLDYKALSDRLDVLMAGGEGDEKPVWIDLIAVDLQRTFSKWIAETTSGRKRALYDVAAIRAKDGDECLRRVLGAYALHNPDLGYTQGMSFIVAMLLLYVEPEEAFNLLVNLLDKSLLKHMFKMDHGRMQLYWEVYDQLLAKSLPRLHAHLDEMGISPNQYLMDWFFTVFSRTVPLELSSMIWDHFMMDGDIFLFRAALGIVKFIEPRLMSDDFADVSWTLKNLALSDSDQDSLARAIKSIDIPAGTAAEVDRITKS